MGLKRQPHLPGRAAALLLSARQALGRGISAAQVHRAALHVLIWLLLQLIVVLAAGEKAPSSLSTDRVSHSCLTVSLRRSCPL